MYAVLYVPDFGLQAVLRARPEGWDEPVVLIEEATPKARVLQQTAAAAAQGIRLGMTSTQAMARCREVRLEARSAAAEHTAREVLLQCALSVSPFLEGTAPGVCTAQLTHPGPVAPERWLRLLDRLRAQHLTARAGIAETPDLALLAAHQAAPFLALDDPDTFLGELAVTALDPSERVRSILEKWGVRTLREFVALGKDALIRRLGSEAATLFDRATGQTHRPLRLVPPPEVYAEFIELEHEVETLDPLLFVLRRFLEQITQRLEALFLSVGELTLELTFSTRVADESILDAPAGAYVRTFRIPEPTCRVETLFRTLQTHLESFTATSPIVALRLSALPSRPGRQQLGLFETALRDPNRFFETLSRLTALVGEGRVGAPGNLDTHRPDSFAIEPLPPEFPAVVAPATARSGLPLRRLRPPRPTQLRPTAAAAASGPWQSSGEWWDLTPWEREEWDVRLADGTLCRIFRQEDGWYLEGHYD